MKREKVLSVFRQQNLEFDILVVGGGATGLGIAVDAAARGYKVALCEQHDFAKGTSSRSTKLVHGGVRYLAQGDVRLVIEALRERGRMRRNAPHLVRDMRFIIGAYRWWEKPFYTIGLILYDILAGRLGLGRSLPMSKNAVKKELPGLAREGLRGGIVYHDGQFDDSRLAITLLQTAQDHGASCLNYCRVESFLKDGNRISGVKAKDMFTGEAFDIKSKVVVNATGVFVDEIMKMDNPQATKKVKPSQGVHLVVDSKFFEGDSALMVPKTKDGRVLFGVPWHGKVVLGTTDTPLNSHALEPVALEEEVDFILDQAGQYLDLKPTRKDVLSVFAGLRPLAAPAKSDSTKTKEISRSHKIYHSKSGLLTITGGKWTTYREMAEEIVDLAIKGSSLESRKCVTKEMKLRGYLKNVDRNNWDYVYGTDIKGVKEIVRKNPEYGKLLDPNYTFTEAHVIWAAREEMAQTVEDVLARRVRALFLDARAAVNMAPRVAELLTQELGKTEEWKNEQVREFNALAKDYILQ
jgi:glycerol-3-phosphate dehydrogenase